MSSYRSLAFIIMCVIVFTAISFSDSPHSNTIPVIAMERPLDVYLGWRDVEDEVYVVDTGLDISPDWIETDPVSIGSISEDWGDYDVEEIWLEFRSSSELATSVRLGWVRLTQ